MQRSDKQEQRRSAEKRHACSVMHVDNEWGSTAEARADFNCFVPKADLISLLPKSLHRRDHIYGDTETRSSIDWAEQCEVRTLYRRAGRCTILAPRSRNIGVLWLFWLPSQVLCSRLREKYPRQYCDRAPKPSTYLHAGSKFILEKYVLTECPRASATCAHT